MQCPHCGVDLPNAIEVIDFGRLTPQRLPIGNDPTVLIGDAMTALPLRDVSPACSLRFDDQPSYRPFQPQRATFHFGAERVE